MKKKLDKPLLAYLLGLPICIPLEIYTQIYKYLGLIEVSALEFSSLVVSIEPNWWIGLMTGPMVGGIITVITYYSTKIFGRDLLKVKSVIIGSFVYSWIMSLRMLFTNYRIATITHFVLASAGILGGLMGGFLLEKYLLDIEGERRFHVRPVSAAKPLAEEKEPPKVKKPRKL